MRSAMPYLLLAATFAGPARAEDAPAALPAMRAPVAATCISSPFGWRRAVGPHAPEGFHNGVDLPAPAGAAVRAALPGTVLRIKRQGLGGVTVHVGHTAGLVTLYAHMGQIAPPIAEGKREVAAGDPLGVVARTGVTYGTHLFFAMIVNGRAIDPAPMLGLPPCRRSRGG